MLLPTFLLLSTFLLLPTFLLAESLPYLFASTLDVDGFPAFAGVFTYVHVIASFSAFVGVPVIVDMMLLVSPSLMASLLLLNVGVSFR